MTDANQSTFKHFYFCLYASNPLRENVRMYIDGDTQLIVMRFEAFEKLIVETVGWQIIAAIRETLHTYGTFWLLDRENSAIRKISLSEGEDIRNIQEMIQNEVKYNTPEARRKRETDTINPAEKLARAKLDLPFFNAPSEEDQSRTKRRGISIITPRE